MRRRATQGNIVENRLENGRRTPALSAQDRALCQELVCGLVRWQRTLDWLIARKTAGRDQKPASASCCALAFTSFSGCNAFPDHAAVHETVELGKRLGFGPQAGFLNAVLRGLHPRTRGKPNSRWKRSSKPIRLWAIPIPRGSSSDGWRAGAPTKRGRLLEWNNTPPPTYARRNNLKTNLPALAARMEGGGR